MLYYVQSVRNFITEKADQAPARRPKKAQVENEVEHLIFMPCRSIPRIACGCRCQYAVPPPRTQPARSAIHQYNDMYRKNHNQTPKTSMCVRMCAPCHYFHVACFI